MLYIYIPVKSLHHDPKMGKNELNGKIWLNSLYNAEYMGDYAPSHNAKNRSRSRSSSRYLRHDDLPKNGLGSRPYVVDGRPPLAVRRHVAARGGANHIVVSAARPQSMLVSCHGSSGTCNGHPRPRCWSPTRLVLLLVLLLALALVVALSAPGYPGPPAVPLPHLHYESIRIRQSHFLFPPKNISNI